MIELSSDAEDGYDSAEDDDGDGQGVAGSDPSSSGDAYEEMAVMDDQPKRRRQTKEKYESKQAADASSKETREEFMRVVEKLVKRQVEIERESGRIVVVIVDGAKTHTCFPPRSNRSKSVSAWNIATLQRYVGLEDKEKKKDELVRIVKRKKKFMMERLWVEEVAEKYGALALFIPNAGPYFNPIEKLWGLLAYHWSVKPQVERTTVGLEKHIDLYMTQPNLLKEPTQNVPREWKPMSHIDKWHRLALQYVRWCAKNQNTAQVPTEYKIMRLSLPPVDVAHLEEKFGNKAKLRSHYAQLAEMCHCLNMYRREKTNGDMWKTKLAKELKF